MKKFNLDLDNSNYASEVISYYLWGQGNKPKPSELADEKWIGRTEEIVLNIDTTQFVHKKAKGSDPK